MNVAHVALVAGLAGCATDLPRQTSTVAAAHEPGAEHVATVFTAKAVGPLAETTPLQVVSIFPHEAGEALLTPATEIAGFLGDARATRGFGAEPLQTLLLKPAPTAMKADALLAVAWGPRADFSAARALEMGHAVIREALKLGVSSMAYAPIARDQGVTTLPADAVAEAFARAAMEELVREAKTAPEGSIHLRELTYEAGPQFVDAVAKALARGVARGRADAGIAPSP